MDTLATPAAALSAEMRARALQPLLDEHGPEMDRRRELTAEVLPAEARLERAVAETKGCYTGQEVVTRMRSRGRVSHLLVGLRFEAGALPAAGAELRKDGRVVGSVTSAVLSSRLGSIGLGFVRRSEAEPGSELETCGHEAHVAPLPFPDEA